MSSGRQTCHCGAQVVEVRIDGSRYLLDWPWSPTGDVAITLTVAGGWLARYAPVGEALRGPEKRFRRHDCQPPAPSITEPRVPAEVPPEQVQRWKQAVAAHNAAKRNQRGKRPVKPITGVRVPPP